MISDEEFAAFFADAYHDRDWPPPLKRQTGSKDALLERVRWVKSSIEHKENAWLTC
jgi:hypothetical protein